MIVAAIDSSLTGTGLARLVITDHGEDEDGERRASWSVMTVKEPVPGDTQYHPAQLTRMRNICKQMAGFIQDADMVIIEAPAYSKGMGMAHERAGLWWMLYAAAGAVMQGHPLVILPNLRAKYATGSGNAGKDTVMLEVSRRYPDSPIRNNNEADATVLAAMGARLAGMEIDQLPKTHLAALKTLQLA